MRIRWVTHREGGVTRRLLKDGSGQTVRVAALGLPVPTIARQVRLGGFSLESSMFKALALAKAAWMFVSGYPMACVEKCRFIDKVSGNEVGLYRDRYGRTFLAEGRLAAFRVPFKTF
jgi:hypothetical protein